MAPNAGNDAVHDYHFCSREESRQARQIIAQVSTDASCRLVELRVSYESYHRYIRTYRERL